MVKAVASAPATLQWLAITSSNIFQAATSTTCCCWFKFFFAIWPATATFAGCCCCWLKGIIASDCYCCITSTSNYCWVFLLLTLPATALLLMLSRLATEILSNSCWCRQCSNIADLISNSNSIGKAAAVHVKSRDNSTFS